MLYFEGVLAPDVFRLVRFSFEEGNTFGVILKESTLELDWTILLWIIYEDIELIPPKDGFETVYSL